MHAPFGYLKGFPYFCFMALHWKIIIAMFLGIAWSLTSGYAGWNEFTLDWIDPFGIIFINCLKFIAIPLVLFSIIAGISGLGNLRQLGRIGSKTLLLYLLTTVVAVSTGLVLVNTFKPGTYNKEDAKLNRIRYELWAKENNIEIKDGKSFLTEASKEELDQASKTLEEEKNGSDFKKMSETNAKNNLQEQGPLQPLLDMVPDNIVKALGDSKLMLQVIFFALFFGIALSLSESKSTELLKSFFQGMNDVFVKMVNLLMAAAPFFVFCLMAGVLVKMADTPSQMINMFKSLSYYAFVVVLGIALLLFGFYPLMLRIFKVKISYKEFFKHMSPAQFLAFSTSSSAATLPVTIRCVQDGLKIPKKVSDFVLPIGATVNMDGTSLYQAVAVIFLAQYHGVDLTVVQQIGIVLTATLASIGAAAVPSAGLIMLMFVLTSVGLNPMWIVIIYPIDRILDMCRTVVNVTSDATVCAIVAKGEEP